MDETLLPDLREQLAVRQKSLELFVALAYIKLQTGEFIDVDNPSVYQDNHLACSIVEGYRYCEELSAILGGSINIDPSRISTIDLGVNALFSELDNATKLYQGRNDIKLGLEVQSGIIKRNVIASIDNKANELLAIFGETGSQKLSHIALLAQDGKFYLNEQSISLMLLHTLVNIIQYERMYFRPGLRPEMEKITKYLEIFRNSNERFKSFISRVEVTEFVTLLNHAVNMNMDLKGHKARFDAWIEADVPDLLLERIHPKSFDVLRIPFIKLLKTLERANHMSIPLILDRLLIQETLRVLLVNVYLPLASDRRFSFINLDPLHQLYFNSYDFLRTPEELIILLGNDATNMRRIKMSQIQMRAENKVWIENEQKYKAEAKYIKINTVKSILIDIEKQISDSLSKS